VSADRIRILQVTGVSVGGSAEHVVLLSRLLDPQHFDVRVALWSGGPLDDRIVATGLPVSFLDGRADHHSGTATAKAFQGGAVGQVVGFVRLVRLIRRERIDIVHTHTSVAGFLGRLAAWVARTPVRLHMAHSIASNDHVSARVRPVYSWIERAIDRITTHYVAGSDAIAVKLVELGITDVQKVTRIHYSFDVERFRFDAASDGERLHAEFHRSPDDVVIGLVGRLEEQKGVELLLQAVPSVVARCPHARIVIVGDGSLRADLEQSTRDLAITDVVRFTGWMSQAGAVMTAIDIMAIPSRWEAFGIVNLEAMAASRPIVGFAVEGIPEVVDDGVTGLLVDAGDVTALADALCQLLESPTRRADLGAAGRARLESHFMPDAMSRAHEELYRRLGTR
jgi:glycosyltransferase involved in cell wall biosynthesis